ncbi:MAG: helix-turn-helix domain-containing protein [Bauldia sp.]
MNDRATIAALEAEIERLRYRVEELEALFGDDRVDPLRALFRLTRIEARVLSMLMARELCSHEGIGQQLYGLDGSDRTRNAHTVQIVHLRKKLQPFGISIETIWGDGYRLAPEAKAKVRALLERREVA